jgi:NTP pyrophosphatase (non-canonical NTP hydrolase)
MTDLNQLAEDSFASAFRRNPNGSDYENIQKIYVEVHELESAYLNEDEDNTSTSEHCPELTATEEELADVIFACLVFAKCENIDVEKALMVKNKFNKTRP